MSHESDRLARFLYRPIVFQQPNRVVHPPSWLEHVPFAFWVVEALRPAILVELGTHSGNSYAAFAQAVQALGLPTAAYAVDTWRGDAQAGFYDESVFAEWSSYHDSHFSAFSRLVRSTFEEAASHFSDGSVNLLHIDGYHTYDAASADFHMWQSKLSRRSVVLFHDINLRERDFGAWQLWEELRTQFPSFEFLHAYGLGVLGTGPEMPEALQWLFSRASASPADVNAIRQFFAQVGAVVSARFAVGQTEERYQAELSARAAAHTHALATQTAEHTTRITELHGQLDARTEQTRQTAVRASELESRLAHEGQQHREVLRHATDRVSDLEARLVIQQRRLEDSRRQASDFEDQLATQATEHETSLRQTGHVVAELRDRLAHLDAERAAATSGSVMGGAPAQPAGAALIGTRSREGLRRARGLLRTAAALGMVPGKPRWNVGSTFRFLRHPEKFREAHAVLATGLFNEGYYRGSYRDVAGSRLTPLAHFVLRGAYEGRSPHPLFDTGYYLHRNPDVATGRCNPLLHYRQNGAAEQRSPHALFDVAFYLERNPDVRDAGVEPLNHYLQFGAADGRDPHPLFDTSEYLERYPDVHASRTNPLVHYVTDGWREGRLPSDGFDPAYYLAQHADVRQMERNPLAHYVESGQFEGRKPMAHEVVAAAPPPTAVVLQPVVRMTAHSLVPAGGDRPTILCLSHVMPWGPRAGNEYRIRRLLLWLRDQGYRIVPVVAPLPGDTVGIEAVRGLADDFSNAVLCGRDGRLDYVLGDVPDVLGSLSDEFSRPASLILGEDFGRKRQDPFLEMDRAFCHDALITTALRLHQVLGRYILLTEYIWMSRILPLIQGDVLKVIDTIDVFSTKRDKVLQFGINDLHVAPEAEAARLRDADLILAIQPEEQRALQKLLPGKRVLTAGVDFDVVDDGGIPLGRKVLYVSSDNPMNRKGLRDFLNFAWPQIRRAVPDAELLLAGSLSRMPGTETSGVVRVGRVDDLKPLYQQARLVINPAVAGTGLKIKTLEAVCHLRPVVTWPSGTDGLAPELASMCVVVQDWYEFAQRVTSALQADEPRVFSPAERDTIVRFTTPAIVYEGLTKALEEVRDGRFGLNRARSAVRR